MKSDLRRIEAALQQVANQYLESGSLSEEMESERLHRSPDAKIGNSDTRLTSGSSDYVVNELTTSLQAIFMSGKATPSVEPGPALPEFTASQDDQHHFVAFTNSALATNLLKDLQTKVGEWMVALEAVIKQIQALYKEGPIVDGWLESFNSDGSFDVDARRVEIAKALRAMNTPSSKLHLTGEPAISEIPGGVVVEGKTAYRLCGLGEDGQVWCRYCPHEQIPDVSLAIVRYQRLQTLLVRKHSLESRLGVLTEALVDVHGRMLEFAE